MPILERSFAPRPRLLAMPVPGGRFANAFALPSSRVPSVLFTAPLLELLTSREQAAILAHEMAHLEHYDRRRCRLATAAGYTVVALGTLGVALALDWLGGGLVVIGWSAALVIAVALRTSHHKTHEAASDLRALALCQDADALISGLTKLTAAGRMPRRWSSEIERHASHPSLARRLQAIRHAAGLAPEPPPSTDALVVSTTRRGARIVVDDHGVSWLRGAASWSVPYAELVELRVAASWWGGTSLCLRDRAGTTRRVRIAAADVRALQQRLDAVDDRLPHGALPTLPRAMAGRLTALGLCVTSVGPLLPLGLIVGLVGAVRPSRASLAAVAGTAAACVLVVFGDLADGSRHWIHAVSASGAVLVMALAAWLAARRRTITWRKADYVPVLIAAGVVAAVAWGQLAAQLLWMRPSPSRLTHMVAGAPALWASLGALGCALTTAPRRALRAGGLAVLVAAVLMNLGVRIGDLEALSRVIAPPSGESRPLPRVATLALPTTPGSLLRVSPLGSRVAVAVGSAPHDGARRLLVLGVAGGRTQVEAHDLYFIDEDSAIVVAEGAEGATVRHVNVADGSKAAGGWRVALGAASRAFDYRRRTTGAGPASAMT